MCLLLLFVNSEYAYNNNIVIKRRRCTICYMSSTDVNTDVGIPPYEIRSATNSALTQYTRKWYKKKKTHFIGAL